MKNKILLFIGLLLLFSSNLSSKEKELLNKSSVLPQGTINVLSSPDLYNLTSKWANEYCRLHPGVIIKVVNSSDVQKVDFSKGRANLNFISNEYYSAFNSESLWKMVI